MFRTFWKIFLKLKGWETTALYPYNHLPKYVLIVAPHTSNWDFVIGLAYRSLYRLHHIHFLGKAELFKAPWGFFFRWLGGTPVERSSNHQMVDAIASLFNNHERYVLALSPEGTRKRVAKLKTGFYFIAKKAAVPIVMVGFDYANKRIVLAEELYTTFDMEDDLQKILQFYRTIKGKFPEQGLGHL